MLEFLEEKRPQDYLTPKVVLGAGLGFIGVLLLILTGGVVLIGLKVAGVDLTPQTPVEKRMQRLKEYEFLTEMDRRETERIRQEWAEEEKAKPVDMSNARPYTEVYDLYQ